MNLTTMNHPTVIENSDRYATATLDAATFARCDRTWTRGGTVLWCGRIVSYVDRTNMSVASVLCGEEEYGRADLTSARWQARIDARAASGDIDLAAEDAAADAVAE